VKGKLFTTVMILCSLMHSNGQQPSRTPRLVKKGNYTQLIVDNKPFLILGGELGNSTASSNQYMRPIWSKLKKLNLNTFFAPVYWELMEPVEGQFDFSLVDSLVKNARLNKMKLVYYGLVP
jgi:GH35 family endo-1,4-beta-xylanase